MSSRGAFALALVLAAPGCMGSFHLTRTVFAFNQQVSDSVVVRELLFIGFVVVPVYEVSLVADAVFLNIVETARKESLLSTGPLQTRSEAAPGGRTVAVVPDPGGDGLWLEVSGQRARRLVRRGEALAVLEGGVPIATVTPERDGSVSVTDRAGAVRRIEAARVQGLLREVSRGDRSLAEAVREGLAP